MSNTNTYVGIADAHGIESWNRIEDTSGQDRAFKQMRANLNRQRHAVYYEADMTEEGAQVVEGILKDGDWELALTHMKAEAETLRGVPGQEKSWELIPNPDLDPYS
ncbi:hypothetical protein CL634_10680 [bacterium]|nr:hypothetical protein [bacterium]